MESPNRRQFLNVTATSALSGLSHSQTGATGSRRVAGPRTRVEEVGGVPTFTVDGKPFMVPGFETYAPQRRYFRQFAEAGTRLFMFNTNVAPCDHVLLEDLAFVEPQRYKLVMFLNCYHISSGQRQTIIRRFQNGGRHLLWFCAPGLFQEHARCVRSMEAVTGFRFRESNEEDRLPLVDDELELQLACGAPPESLVARSKRDWTTLYARVPSLSAGTFRELAKRAGAHIFSHRDDVLYANSSLLVIHACDSGPRTLFFPFVSETTDPLAGGSVRRGRQITLDLAAGETRWLRWQRAP